jgi:acyl-coenzyme A synthetase/AMP-(fatty) acid ligase
VVVAQVRLAHGREVDAETLRQHARRTLAGFKQPRRLEVVADFPRTAAGKILRRAVARDADRR